MESCTDENRGDRGSNLLIYFVCLFVLSFVYFVGHFSECMNSKS
jgi:hypothetical protein